MTKNLEFNYFLHPSLSETIKTDNIRLNQILINLTANFLKFTQTGGITITIVPDPHNPERIMFKVTDTGIGIQPEDCAKLFQMFGKLTSSLDLNQEGVGLGLMISNTLVKVLNRNEDDAFIRVDSTPGKGSTFYFSIYKNGFRTETSPVETGNLGLEHDEIEEDDELIIPEFQSIIKHCLPPPRNHQLGKLPMMILQILQTSEIIVWTVWSS